ncbi:MAG: bifunctional riboflavin kinase/FAD synthetase [Dokdonella sp.]|nr:MAG: bifunctional riboflavin kinase/FAD synthetase [Dokdonella sp.]
MNRLFRDAAGPSLAPGGSVVCVGAFDGVHLGHRALLARTCARARELGLQSLAVTFEPVPREYFAQGHAVPRLTSARDKLALLLDSGIGRVLALRFNAHLTAMSATAFVEQLLLARAGMRELWVGADFHFGHARRGNVALLEQLASARSFTLQVLADVREGDERVSSSALRALLALGEFDAAARGLGRRFSIGGHVVRGLQLGRKLGYPTANLRLGRRTAPLGGIFAVRVHGVAATALPGVASLGIRPTVAGTEPLLEAHLFDFDGDLYGRRIEVEFVAKLRDERKFDDLPAMVRQIERDAAQARELLAARRCA